MTTSMDEFSAELSISDPWDAASCVASPLRGSVLHLSGNSALVRLNEPILICGVLARSALATPRHVGDCFERSSRSVPANIVLSASLVPNLDRLGEVQQAAAPDPFIATMGTVSFMEGRDGEAAPTGRTDPAK
jgi:hypothetical protein